VQLQPYFDQGENVSNLKAPTRLVLLDCTAPIEKTGIHTVLRLDPYKSRADALANRKVDITVFRPEAEGRMPNLKEFDAMVLADSSHTPTREFVERSELWKMLPEFINNVVESGKLSLCICFGMEAVAATYGVYPESVREGISGKLFNLGYSRVSLTYEAQRDLLFSAHEQQFYGIFAHRYFVPSLPQGAVQLAKNTFNSIAAFKVGNVYCVQWQPDLDLTMLIESAENHRSSHAAEDGRFEPMLNRFGILNKYRDGYDEQNSQVLDLFFRKIIE